MSDTNRYTKIEIPNLDESKYGENLSTQFNNINNNFARLSTGDFMKGEAGDSIEFIKITFENIKNHITKKEDKDIDKTNTIQWLLINNIKLQILYDTGLFNIDNNSNNIIISDICVICKKGILNQNIDKPNDVIFDLIKDIYISPIYIFNTKISDDAKNNNITQIKDEQKNNINTYNDFTCVYMYNITEFIKNAMPVFGIRSSKHLISNSAYFDRGKNCICWRINGYNTGIPIQGPAGIDGKSGKILIGTYKTNDDNGYTDPVNIINNISDSAEDLSGNSIILTGTNNYKTYISTLENDNNGGYKAKIQSSQDITKLFGENGLIIPFASDAMNTDQGFTIKAVDQENDDKTVAKRLLSINTKTDTLVQPDIPSDINYEVTFNNILVSANNIWSAILNVGNADSAVDHTATIYKGLQIQNEQNDGNLLTADNNGFYVGVKDTKIDSSDNNSKPDNKIVVISELNEVKDNFNEKLQNYYNKDDEKSLISLIKENSTSITLNDDTTVINGTVIDKNNYNTLSTNATEPNKIKLNNHLYFIYDN